jgi:hypothetical protein
MSGFIVIYAKAHLFFSATVFIIVHMHGNTNQGACNMASQSNLKHLKFTAALAPKSLSRACATLVVCLIATGFGTANADVIADRKAGFKRNADSMKAIAAAIGSGDYQTVISRAEGIARLGKHNPKLFS